MKKGLMAIVALLVLSVVAIGAYAMPLNARGNEEIKEAIETGDYDAYLNAFNYRQPLSEDDFDGIHQRHQLRNSHKEEMDLAIEQGYDAWIEVVEDMDHTPPMYEMVSEENFDIFVDLHEARESGDWETARTLSEELGFESGRMGRGHRGMQMNN